MKNAVPGIAKQKLFFIIFVQFYHQKPICNNLGHLNV